MFYPPPLKRVVFPVEASLNRLLWNRSISPNSLLETSISEEVRPRDLEEEEASQSLGPLLPPNTTSRRHTLAEVSTPFHQCNPACKYDENHNEKNISHHLSSVGESLSLSLFFHIKASWSVPLMVPPLTAVSSPRPATPLQCRLLCVRCQHLWPWGQKVELLCQELLPWPSPPTSSPRLRVACLLPAFKRGVELLTPPSHKVQDHETNPHLSNHIPYSSHIS